MLVSLAKQAAAVAVAMLAMVASIQACKDGHLPSGRTILLHFLRDL